MADFDIEGARKAGYSDQEIQAYMAQRQQQRDQPIVSEPFKQRIETGNKFTRIFGKVADAAKEGIGESQFGFEPDSENTMFLQKIGVFGNPENGRPGMLLGGVELGAKPAAYVLDAFARGIRSGAYSVGGLFGAISEEMGASQGEANRLKRDIGAGLDFAAQIAPMLHMQMGMPTPQSTVNAWNRTRLTPDGKVRDEAIGGFPTEQSFIDATNALTDGAFRPEIADKLRELYDKHGYHPAEVFNDAREDPVLRGQLLALGNELPEQLVGKGREITLEKNAEPGVPGKPAETQVGPGGEPPKQPPPEPPKSAGPPEPPKDLTGSAERWQAANEAIERHISVGEGEKVPAWLDRGRIYEATIDRLFPLKSAAKYAIDLGVDLAVSDNPYVAGRLYAGFAGKAEVMLKYEGPFDFFTYKNVGPSLQQILKPVQDEIGTFRNFAVSMRALELAKRDIRTGFNLEAAKELTEIAPPRYREAMTQLVNYQNQVAAYLRDSGVLSRKGYAAMVEANQLYLPFHAVVDEAGLGINTRGASLTPQNPVHRIKGADWKKIDPLESVIKNTFIMTAMAERNVVGTKLVNMFAAVDKITGELTAKRQYEGPTLIGKAADAAQLEGNQKRLAGPQGTSLVNRQTASEVARTGEGTEVGSLMEKKLRDYGYKDPPPDLTQMLESLAKPLADDEIRVFENGRAVLYTVDKDVARAIKNLDQESVHWIFKAMGVPANMLKAGAVLTPDFWARHLFRENFYAAATYEHGAFTPIDQMKGLAGWVMHDQDFINWFKGGGAHTSMVALDRDYLQENLHELTAKTGLMTRAWNVVGHPITTMRAATEVALSATHFGAFKKRMRQLETETSEGKTPPAPLPGITSQVEVDAPRLGQMHRRNWLAKGETGALYIRDQAAMKDAFKAFGYDPETGVFSDITTLDQADKQRIIDAAWVSRDTSVDNSRMGSKMAVVNTVSAFANAKIQDVSRGLFEAGTRQPAKFLGVAGLTIAAPSVLVYALFHNDPRYRDAKRWEKDTFWLVPTDKWEPARPEEAAKRPPELVRINEYGQLEVNNGATIRLPKPFSLGVIAGSSMERILEKWHRDNPRAFDSYVNSLFESTVGDLIPNAIVPPIEQAMNTTRFTGQTLIPSQLEKQLPEYQYTPYTTELSKKLGAIVSEIPGVHALTTPKDRNTFQGTAAAFSSPMLIENMIRGWGGTLGLYALQTLDAAGRKAGVLNDPPHAASKWTESPFIRAFTVRYPTASPQVVQDLYDAVGEMKRLRDTFQAQAKDGNQQAMERIMALDGGGFLMRAENATQALTVMTKAVNMIDKNPTMPASEKRQLIDGIYYQIQGIAQQELKAIDAVRKSMKEKQP